MELVESSENAPCASIEHVLQSLVEPVHCGMRWEGLLWESGEWHESMEEKRKDGWRRMHCWVGGRMGKVESTESITQLSAGVIVRWINLCWNADRLKSGRLRRRRGGAGCGREGPWGCTVMKQDQKRRLPPPGTERFLSNQSVTSVLFCQNPFLCQSTNVKNTRHVRKAHGIWDVWNAHITNCSYGNNSTWLLKDS